jgi:hypothetical protein
MLRVNIPKDIRSYESHIVGGLTPRNCICLGIGAIFCYLTYAYIGQPNHITIDNMVPMFVAVMIIPFLFGFVKPYGMPFEKFLRIVVVTSIVAPHKRLYHTVNTYDVRQKLVEPNANAAPASAREIRQHPEYEPFE